MTKLWAIADLHLSFSVPEKTMEAFGPTWENYQEKIENNWKTTIQDEDIVLIPGDISWAMRFEQALTDLLWLDKLPGKKIIIKGNHDYWWASKSKMQEALPSSILFIQNDALTIGPYTFGGARLWDTDEYHFNDFSNNPSARFIPKSSSESEKIFSRELERMELSLSKMDKTKTKVALCHYPPIGHDLKPSRASAILEKHQVELCVFGHLHNMRTNALEFGKASGCTYKLTAADYLDFHPLRLY